MWACASVCVRNQFCLRACVRAGGRCVPEGAHEADDTDGYGDGAEGDEGHGHDEEIEHAPAEEEGSRKTSL